MSRLPSVDVTSLGLSPLDCQVKGGWDPRRWSGRPTTSKSTRHPGIRVTWPSTSASAVGRAEQPALPVGVRGGGARLLGVRGFPDHHLRSDAEPAAMPCGGGAERVVGELGAAARGGGGAAGGAGGVLPAASGILSVLSAAKAEIGGVAGVDRVGTGGWDAVVTRGVPACEAEGVPSVPYRPPPPDASYRGQTYTPAAPSFRISSASVNSSHSRSSASS